MKRKNKNGLTLIELMVAAAASSIVILTVAVILIMAIRSWRINNAYVDMRRDAALAVYLMARDIREANINTVTAAVNVLRVPAATYTKSGNALNSTDFGTIIRTNVNVFSSSKTNSAGDGVYLTIGMFNPAFGITLTNQVFVNTRN